MQMVSGGPSRISDRCDVIAGLHGLSQSHVYGPAVRVVRLYAAAVIPVRRTCGPAHRNLHMFKRVQSAEEQLREIGRASCRERV